MRRPFKDSKIVQYDRNVEPLVVVRDLHRSINEGMEDRSFLPKWATLRYSRSPIGLISGELSFHESQIENDFSFSPQSMDNRIESKQGTNVRNLGGKPAELANLLNRLFVAEFDFAELDAASQGEQWLADYEFTYEFFINTARIDGVDLDQRIREEL